MDYRNYTNQFSMSKTLRFRLIPVGKTEELFHEKKMLETDNERANKYKVVKELIDRYHKDYIERKLSDFKFDEKTLSEYAEYYAHFSEKGKELEELRREMYKRISNYLTGDAKNKNEEYKKICGKEMITELLPKLELSSEEKEAVDLFKKFTTYFTGFNQNRENMYTGKGDSTEIAYRIVAQNLPKFIDNLKTWNKITEMLPKSEIEAVDSDMVGLIGLTHDEIFRGIGSFNLFISQSGIDKYNQYIGGYTCEDGTEIQGLNQKINLYCQREKKKIPLLKPLFKQILSDRESLSFILDSFETDEQVINALQRYYEGTKDKIAALTALLSSVGDYPSDQIYVKNDLSVNTLSQIVFGNWSVFQTGIEIDYSEKNPRKAKEDEEKYTDKRRNELKKRADYSLTELAYFASKYPYELTDNDGNVCRTSDIDIITRISEYANELKTTIDTSVKPMEELWSSDDYSGKNLAKDDDTIAIIKAFLDNIKAFQHFTELFAGDESEPDKEPIFYGEFVPAYEELKEINHLYDKVRNYITKKPYSDEKIKIMFDRSDFWSGWAQPDEWCKQEAHLFEKDGKYYVFITDHSLKENEWKDCLFTEHTNELAYHIKYLFQKPDNKNTPRLFIRSKGTGYAPAVKEYNLPIEEVIDIYDNGYFKTEYRKTNPDEYRKALTKMIDYFKIGFSRHKAYKDFLYKWKPSEEYSDISEFYHDTEISCYELKKEPVNYNGLLAMVEKGFGFLFQLYNKDFSEYSHGKPNLHTLYFKALFDEDNLADVCFKMNGGAEMFYRKPSLKLEDTTVHPKNVPLKNKNELNPKKESTFEYDLIKDKRYTKPQFSLHLPITMNYKAADFVNLNEKVRADLANTTDQYIIGIDRGERNLIYYSVIDSNGRIVEQESLNIIENIYKDVPYRTDYQKLLADREAKRQQSRQNWTTIEGIKELKEGYLSQAVHKICQLVLKYNAIIVMENLNSGFKNTRSAVERSVYQKFEKMLTDKLAFLADKSIPATEPGGILHAYQLCVPVTSYNDMRGQNGIIFYVDPWLTSKIDPMTGFSNQFHAKYESVDKAKEFFRSFDSISFNTDTDRFEFVKTVDVYETHKTWKIETYGDRIEAFKNKDKNSSWDSRTVLLTDEFKDLFDRYGIDYRNADLMTAIEAQAEKRFFEKLIHLFNLTVQMRNSVPNSTKPEDDYMISPVAAPDGRFYDSRCGAETLPKDADANGAYNIARKGLILVERAQTAENPKDSLGGVRRPEWLKYAIEHPLK